MTSSLTHLDDSGSAHMVDVGGKLTTKRIAIATGDVVMKPETLALILSGTLKKGDAFTVAKIAGISAAKHTADLIPLCHTLPLTHVEVLFDPDLTLPGVHVKATVKTEGKTGVEMEALTAVTIAALTIYDMAKAVEKSMCIQNVHLIHKSGGASGTVNLSGSE
jgi:cyclic pyranopterin monophosphate synthase